MFDCNLSMRFLISCNEFGLQENSLVKGFLFLGKLDIISSGTNLSIDIVGTPLLIQSNVVVLNDVTY